jgi:hypothetical protein
VLIAVVLTALPAAARAQVVTFGGDLSLPDNVTFDCSLMPSGRGFVATGVGSCTWSSFAVPQNRAQGLVVPSGNGTVTQARIKVGATTGPMQVVVLEAQRRVSNNTVGCCQQVGQSEVFTPQANTITTVPLELPVRDDQTPDQNGIVAFDMLGISILEASVPIPAFDSGIHDANGPNDIVDFPASQPDSSVQPSDAFGIELLLNADWRPTGAPSSGPPPTTPPVVTGSPLRFDQRTALVRRNQALIDLTCTLAAPCPGTLLLQNRPAQGATLVSAAVTKPHKLVTYGTASFRVPAGESQTVAAKLKAAGRTLTRAHKKPRVWVNVTLPDPPTSISTEITLHH